MTYIQSKDLTVNRMRRTRFSNSFSGTSGALGDGDRGSWQSMPDSTGNPYQYSNFIERWRQYCKLYEMCWEARKIVRIPVEDALRKQWEVEEVPDAMLDVLKEQNIKFKFEESLSRAMMLERLLGGCIQFFGMDSDSDDVSKPYRARVESSKLRFINTIPLSRISRVNWETDPLKEGYMRPHEFIINGHTMHISRCVLWDGEPLFDPYDFALTQFRANLAGFGPSKLAPIWDDIIKAVGTRQAAYQLIQTNNALIMTVNELQDLMATNPGKANITKLKEIANSLSVYRAAIIQKDKVDISQHSASFGSVPELLMTFLQVLSAASDIPATRFLGQAPGGLNATGESDLENYYNMIDALQRKRIEPAIRKFYDIIGYHKWPDMWYQVRRKMEIKFPPLWNINELEEAQKNQIEIANVFQAWEAGIMPDEKAIEELNLKQVFSVDLDEKDIDLTKAAGVGGDDAGFYGDDSGAETPLSSPQQPTGGSNDGGQGKGVSQKHEAAVEPLKAPEMKKPSLPKIENADKWITVHPRGKDNTGEPALIDGESGEVKAGMGGKFNGESISKIHKKQDEVPKTEIKEVKKQDEVPKASKVLGQIETLPTYAKNPIKITFGKNTTSEQKKQVEKAALYLDKRDIMEGLIFNLSEMKNRYGTSSGKNIYLDSNSLKKEHPIFIAAIMKHEAVHSRNHFEKRTSSSEQDEFQARFQTKMWASLKLGKANEEEKRVLNRIIKESTTK